jgi:hypothetical protein
MVKYNESKIFKIVCNITGLIYIGYTVQDLSKTFSMHRKYFKNNI